MAVLDFPDPSVSQTYYYEGVTYTWKTNKWTAYGPTAGMLPVLVEPEGNVVIKGNLSVNKDINQDPNAEQTATDTNGTPLYPDVAGNVVISGNLAVNGEIDDN